jgi:transcription initiation factor TFIID subunit 15
MGKIPARSNMITAVITSPKVGVKMPSNTTFNIEVQTQHLTAGFFTNPTTNYYTAPQDLDKNGDIIGHCHVTVQDMGSMTATTPPDPVTFAFFKGIDDAGNGQGLLKAVVTDGLPAGIYRVCTMISAQNHQPVAMPVAQRGAQDDCTKFEIVDAGNGGQKQSPNNKNGDGTKNQDQEGVLKNKGDKGNGAGGQGKPGGEGKAGGEGKVGGQGKAGGEGQPGGEGKPGGEGRRKFRRAYRPQGAW